MSAADLVTTASFVDDNREEITAVATVAVAFVIAELVNRALKRRGRSFSEAVAGGRLSPETDTRLRVIRRLIFATIILFGVALALAQFPSVKRVATGILASSAVLGLVVGFAARATLANAIAGVLLAISQPIRIGDLVSFEDDTGEVEDIGLSYTRLRLDDGSRLVIPNERLAQSSLQNLTVVDPRVEIEVSVWVPHTADADRALELIAGEEGVDASVAEVDKEGVRLSARAWARTPDDRGVTASRLRALWLRRLRQEGLFSESAP
jgi:small-conductance mechanosensitive channel